MRFAIFPLHLSKVLRLPRKIDARSYEVLHLSRKIILANLQIWCSKMQPLSGNQRPDLLTSLMNMSFVLRLPRKMRLFKCPMPAIVFGNATKPSRFAHFWRGAQSLAPATRNDIWTSKSGPNVVCFVHVDFEMCFAPQWHALFRHPNLQKWSGPSVCFGHFHFEMCFAPQRRALFRHLNFQKWSENVVLCTFSVRNVLRATTACNFSSLIWPAGSAPAALASLLFDPPEPQIIGKTQCFATFLPLRASASAFFWLFLFSDLLWSSLFYSPLLSTSAQLCFSSVHIVGNLTLNFRRIITTIYWFRSIRPFVRSSIRLSSHIAVIHPSIDPSTYPFLIISPSNIIYLVGICT